jgi:hypothetical protein
VERDPDTAYARTPIDQSQALAVVDKRRVLLDAQGRVTATRDMEVFEGRPINPGVPLYPWLPRGEDPRQFYIQSGYNLNYVPRSEYRQLTPFALLRNLAATSDLVQIARQEVIDAILSLEWDVVPEDPKEQRAKGMKEECDFAKNFLAYPDRVHSFEGWLHTLLLDALDIDALCFYRRRTVTGEPHSLMAIDGATIKPILDWHGIPPEPPEVAYQQIIAGVPETEFSRPYLPVMEGEETDPTELVYSPFSPRTYNGYGQSPLERVLITVNLTLRRQLHHLAYFTDGNIPDAFWKCPDAWTAAQIFDFQEKLEKLLSGESGQRRKLRMMPGGEGTGLELPHGTEQEPNGLNEFLARTIAMAYHTSPQPLVSMMNRATAEQADTSSSQSGHHYWMHKVRKMLSRELREYLRIDGVKFIYVEDKHRDETAWTAKAIAFIGHGVYTRNHVLNEEGLEPIEGGDVPTVDTPSGPVPLADFIAGGGGAPTEGGAAVARRVLSAVPPIPAAGPSVDSAAAAAALKDVPQIPAATEKGMMDDLRRWRKVAHKAATGEPDWRKRTPERLQKVLAFKSDAIPPALHYAVTLALEDALAHPGVKPRLDWIFGAMVKARRPLVAIRRRLRHEKVLRAVVKEHFKKITPAVVEVAVKMFTDLQKADDLDDAMQIDLLMESLREPLAETYLDGEVLAADQSGIEIAFGLTEENATDYAERRAAELVGKRKLSDGTFIDSPNPDVAITETLRRDLKDAITRALEEGVTESELRDAIQEETGWGYRAERIARTEVAVALNQGAAETYSGAGINTVTILDGPGCLESGHDDEEEGVNGEVWSIAKWQDFPVGHPFCVRDGIPNVREA